MVRDEGVARSWPGRFVKAFGPSGRSIPRTSSRIGSSASPTMWRSTTCAGRGPRIVSIDDEALGRDMADVLADAREPSAFDRAMRRDFRDDLDAALATLRPEFRRLVVMRYLEDMSYGGHLGGRGAAPRNGQEPPPSGQGRARPPAGRRRMGPGPPGRSDDCNLERGRSRRKDWTAMTTHVDREIREWLEAEAAGCADEADRRFRSVSRGLERMAAPAGFADAVIARLGASRGAPGRLLESLGPGRGGRRRRARGRRSGARADARVAGGVAGLRAGRGRWGQPGRHLAARRGWPAASLCGAGWRMRRPSSDGSSWARFRSGCWL